MKNDVLYDAGCLIYPGAYVPLLKEEEVQEELKRTYKGETVFPPVNVIELADSLKVEVAIPGAKRENFLVHADENILSVCVVHKECGLHEGETFQLHEFNCDFERDIILPDNTDSGFISAEYKSGILRLYVPKAKHPAKNLHTSHLIFK